MPGVPPLAAQIPDLSLQPTLTSVVIHSSKGVQNLNFSTCVMGQWDPISLMTTGGCKQMAWPMDGPRHMVTSVTPGESCVCPPHMCMFSRHPWRERPQAEVLTPRQHLTKTHSPDAADRYEQAQALTSRPRHTPRPPHMGRPAHRPRRAACKRCRHPDAPA